MVSTAGKHCAATNKRGQPCRAYCVAGSDFCQAHAPERAAQRAKARQKGGKARHGRQVGTVGEETLVEIGTVGDVLRLVERAINDCLRMENSLARSRTLGSLATVALKAIEVGEMEERLAALEQRLAAQGM